MRRLTLLFVMFVMAGMAVSGGSPVQAQGTQARIDFVNNTSVALSFYANGTYQCKVIVQHGICGAYVAPGSTRVEARLNDGTVGASDQITTQAGKTFTWTINEE